MSVYPPDMLKDVERALHPSSIRSVEIQRFRVTNAQWNRFRSFWNSCITLEAWTTDDQPPSKFNRPWTLLVSFDVAGLLNGFENWPPKDFGRESDPSNLGLPCFQIKCSINNFHPTAWGCWLYGVVVQRLSFRMMNWFIASNMVLSENMVLWPTSELRG